MSDPHRVIHVNNSATPLMSFTSAPSATSPTSWHQWHYNVKTSPKSDTSSVMSSRQPRQSRHPSSGSVMSPCQQHQSHQPRLAATSAESQWLAKTKNVIMSVQQEFIVFLIVGIMNWLSISTRQHCSPILIFVFFFLPQKSFVQQLICFCSMCFFS